MPVFDAYLAVDWSASSQPKAGADSIWYAVLERGADGRWQERPPCNPRTRAAARAEVAAILADLVARDRRVLVGCDFPYALPAGTAAALGLDGAAPWRALWQYLAGAIQDGPDNANNRFTVAARMNQRLTGRPFPYWGCPVSPGPYLERTKGSRQPTDRLAEKRFADNHAAGAKSPWQLYGAGSVGSQTLVGIPALAGWRWDPRLAERSVVWPFETGLGVLARPGAGGWRVLHAEIFPSLLGKLPVGKDEIKDQVQVRELVRKLADLDEREQLAALFELPPGFTPMERTMIEREEGWILDPGDALPPKQPAELVFTVPAAPPAKDGALSIFNPAHPHYPRVEALRAAIRLALVGREPLGGGPVRLEVVYRRATRNGDALNMMNGIADVLQRRATHPDYQGDVWAIEDDHEIRAFGYQELPAERDSYQVKLSRLEG